MPYLKAIPEDLQGVAVGNKIVLEAHEPLAVNTDRAVLVALLVGELVTNAAKHAYPADAPGKIQVRVARDEDGGVSVSVRGDDKGLPENCDLENGGLGMTIVDTFVEQSGAKFEFRRLREGTEFVLRVSRERWNLRDEIAPSKRTTTGLHSVFLLAGRVPAKAG